MTPHGSPFGFPAISVITLGDVPRAVRALEGTNEGGTGSNERGWGSGKRRGLVLHLRRADILTLASLTVNLYLWWFLTGSL